MIDYEKLQRAHELVYEYAKYKNETISFTTILNRESEEYPEIFEIKKDDNLLHATPYIDNLIHEFTRITKPICHPNNIATAGSVYMICEICGMCYWHKKLEPKYKVGDEVFAINQDDFKPMKLVIEKIEYSDTVNEFIYDFQNSFSCRCESRLFPNCEALIEHQIKYWQSLHEPDIQINQSRVDINSCQHETGPIVSYMLAKDLVCIKCHEYFLRKFIFDDGCEHVWAMTGSWVCLKCGVDFTNDNHK
jgi:hypothetical protein